MDAHRGLECSRWLGLSSADDGGKSVSGNATPDPHSARRVFVCERVVVHILDYAKRVCANGIRRRNVLS